MMTSEQLTFLASEAACDTRHSVGALGERIAANLLEKAGYSVSFTHPGERRGDLRVCNPTTGEVHHIEVKTARRGKDGKWRFTLVKDGATDFRDSDFVLLLAVLKTGKTTLFFIPVPELGQRRQICITSHPESYAGLFCKYRTRSIRL